MRKIVLVVSVFYLLFIGFLFIRGFDDGTEMVDSSNGEHLNEQFKRQELVGSTLRELFTYQLDGVGQNLIGFQNPEGNFVFQRFVENGKDTGVLDNIVQQSGAVYALARMYNFTGDIKYKDAFMNALDYFATLEDFTEVDGETSRYFQYQGSVQNNAVAMMVLAYLEILDKDGNLPDAQMVELNQMANTIVWSGQEDGAFHNYNNADFDIGDCWESDYNNGESLVAIVRMYELTEDQKYMDVIEKAVPYDMDKYGVYEPAFYTWGVTAFADLYHITGDQKYSEYIIDRSNQLLEQSGYENIQNYLMGTVEGIPDNSQIINSEGLIATLKVDDVDTEKYQRAIVDSALFQILAQSVWDGDVSSDVYEIVGGGFCDDPYCKAQRVDTQQYTLSVFIDALTYLDDETLDTSVGDYLWVEN